MEDQHTQGVGTRGFKAPEVIDGGEYSFPCDIYSFALSLEDIFHDLLNRPENIRERALVQKMRERDPQLRQDPLELFDIAAEVRRKRGYVELDTLAIIAEDLKKRLQDIEAKASELDFETFSEELSSSSSSDSDTD